MHLFAGRHPRRASFVGLLVLLVTACVIGAAARATAQPAPPQRWDGYFELVTSLFNRQPPLPPPDAANAPSRASRHAISADGRYVVFDSTATNLGSPGVFRRDRRGNPGEMLVPGLARNVAISADGNHIAYEQCSLVCQVWVRDLRRPAPVPVSLTPANAFGDSDSTDPVLSSNGRFVVFSTKAFNLTGGAGGRKQVVIRDRDVDNDGLFDETGTHGVSLVTTGAQGAGNADSETAEVSDDGRYVAFRSAAFNLVTPDLPGTWDVFLKDRQTGETRRLNQRFGGPSPDSIVEPQISMTPDGRWVAFASADPMLVPMPFGDTNGTLDVHIYDRQTASLSRLDVGDLSGIAAPGNGPTGWPTLSADGRYVSLQSAATNAPWLSQTGMVQAYVVDRLLKTTTRVSVLPEGVEPGQSSNGPQLSADASVVLFWSTATSFASIAPPANPQLYAAAHLAITPADVRVPSTGGTMTRFTITAQAHTAWQTALPNVPWAYFGGPSQGVGNGDTYIFVSQPNPNPVPRTLPVRVGMATATVTQEVGLTIASISPASGPMSGGTPVTIRGTGFVPGMIAYFGSGGSVATTFVDDTTLLALTPASPFQLPVMVIVETPDYQSVWLDFGFTYLDDTPPFLFASAYGPQGQNGWFTGDVSVNWLMGDEQSAVTSTTCVATVVTQDTAGTTFTCTATSQGGTTSASVFVKRDATPPVIAMTVPRTRELVAPGSILPAAFTCSDALSGVADCGGPNPPGTPLYTGASGWQWFGVSATDAAGNVGLGSAEYAVATGVCTAPLEGWKALLRFENNISNLIAAYNGRQMTYDQPRFVPGVAGQAALFAANSGPYSLENYGWLDVTTALSVSLWLKPDAGYPVSRLVSNPVQFHLDRSSTGTLAWTLLRPDGGTPFTGTSTAPAPQGVWTHVALTYAAGEVKLYVNGRVDGTWTVDLPALVDAAGQNLTIGASPDLTRRYNGAMDELHVYAVAIPASFVEAAYLSGGPGVCPPAFTTMTIPPITTTVGAGSYHAVAILKDMAGVPVPGKTVRLIQQAAVPPGEPYPTTTAVTDANGRVEWDAPYTGGAGWQSGFAASFDGDIHHVRSSNLVSINVAKATPQLTWTTPAPIPYGTPLGSAQLNATANVPGSFFYSPSWNQVLGAGTRTLRADFTPTNPADYVAGSTTVTLEVLKAVPAMTVGGGPFTFDGQPHPAVVSVTNYAGQTLNGATVTYNGQAAPPAGAGDYAVVATYPGDANHEARTVTATLTIGKAIPWIAFSPWYSVTYNGQPRVVTATVTGGGGVALGTVPVTYAGSTTPPVDAGTYVVSATFEGDANHVARTATYTHTIAKATPSIALPPQPEVHHWDGQPHPTAATVTGAGGVVLGAATVTYDGGAAVPVNVGTYAVSATFAGNANYTSAAASGSLQILRTTPLMTLTPQNATYVFDGQPHAVTAAVTAQNGVVLDVPVTIAYNGGPTPPVNAGSYSVTATIQATANYIGVTRLASVQITQATPVVTVTGGAFVYDGEPHAATATVVAPNGLVPPGPLTVTYNSSANVPVQAGSYQVSAWIVESPNYRYAYGTSTITIAKAVPVVTIQTGAFTFDSQLHPATATVTGVGGAVVGTATVSHKRDGVYAQPQFAGTYEVEAVFTGNANYEAAAATATFVILPATPTITFNPPAEIVYGTVLTSWDLRTSSSGVPGTFVVSPAPGVRLNASPEPQALTAAFTSESPNFTSTTVTRTILVRRAVPVVGGSFSNVFYDGLPHPASASARGVDWESLEPITVTYNGSTEVPVNAGVYSIVTSYAGSTNYEAASSTTTAEIYKRSVGQTSWNGLGTLVYGTPLGPAQFDTTASIPGSFSFSPGPGAILDVGAHTITATFTPADPNYNTATLTRTFTVTAATPTLTVTAGTFAYDGQPHAASATVTGVGGGVLGPVTFTYNGSTAIPVAAGTYTVVASYAGGGNYAGTSQNATLTIGKAVPTLSWAAPAPLPYGPTLGATQLNAQASVPGTFSYSPGPATRLPAGAHTLSATFTPTDATNHSGGTVTTSITIVPTPLEIRAIDSAKVYGAPLPAFTASFTGLASGQTVANLSGTLAFATAATAASPVGTYAVTPAGLSSPNYAITFVAGTLTIVKAPVAMTLTASPTPSGLDMPITFTATVAAAQSAPAAPTGTVRFFDGTTLVGTATLASGTATLLTGGLTAGTHTIEARYDGDASFDLGTRTASHVVNTAAATPAITITSSRQPASTGQSITFTATITVATSGTIRFYDGNTLLGSGAIASGRATLATSSLAAGSHAITARFQGNASAPPVISPVFVQAVNGSGYKDRTSTLAVVSSANPSALGAAVTFTATASGSSGTPTGRILFMVDGLVVGDPAGVAMASGQAVVSISTLAGGRHKVTATFLGNSNYRGSNGALTQTVN